ncbi:uncharacterized protein BP01DRAFT_353150 [Aspergillus saccharolyticus JOP 1030-1]|uniref:Uncharacterized protein n=1 Tax=Aspergillus saccharolyticus JOP 1030-1 TaxID=1450539 RepID=A0A318ZMM7_9EURO|nr:hypothetical protein BP01DRAFT_353150 [Aspergillus saccharolyticus JOP 1030-1]PYH48849.1 hypothetical protein BP01DRAFT_353150 [Aspergillus saccharolyticus JOP 1030-1]
MMLPLVAASAFLVGSAAGTVTELQSVLRNTHLSNDYGYPTDFTRGVMPIPVHSHNDYWRDIPFYTGLSKGCISTEADVWLYNGTLYVGHDESSLTEKRTLESLYINPILDVLQRQNPTTRFVTSPTKNGVFDTDTSQTLYFFIDLKTAGPETLDAVIKALEPLRARGYLTTLKDNTTITQGPVTVIGTGNTPLDLVGPVANRDYFFDAPLDQLDESPFNEITGLISPIASTSFGAAVGPLSHSELNETQTQAIRAQISAAKEKGIGARYWGTPYYPIRTRNNIWRTLLEEGVALLNADDLDAVAGYF